jgi:hypothetical protein
VIVTPIEFSFTLDRDENRTSGLHLTDISSAIALKIGYLDAKYGEQDINDPTGVFRIALGLSFEDYIVPKHGAELLYHPGEVTVDGISMTTDAISVSPDMAVHEFKCTWKSMRHATNIEGSTKLWQWLVQTKGYCKGWNTTRAYWHIMWVNGDYSYSETGGTSYRIYKLDFTRQEIEDNWSMLKNYTKIENGRRVLINAISGK